MEKGTEECCGCVGEGQKLLNCTLWLVERLRRRVYTQLEQAYTKHTHKHSTLAHTKTQHRQTDTHTHTHFIVHYIYGRWLYYELRQAYYISCAVFKKYIHASVFKLSVFWLFLLVQYKKGATNTHTNNNKQRLTKPDDTLFDVAMCLCDFYLHLDPFATKPVLQNIQHTTTTTPTTTPCTP